VLPFAAGSGTDTTTRIISKELGTGLGVGMVIDNKAGASGSIAASYAARSAPDGYAVQHQYPIRQIRMLKTMTYDPVKIHAGRHTGDLPHAVDPPGIPANSVAGSLAKKEPGKCSYASSSSARIRGDIRASPASTCFTSPTARRALTDLIAGRVSMMFIDVPTGLPHVNAKALKALAVTTKQRSALLPHLPTMDDTVKGFDITSWQGYFGPAGMPKDVVTRLNAEIRKVVERPDIKAALAERGMEAFSGTPESFDAFVKEQLKVWEKLIAGAGIKEVEEVRFYAAHLTEKFIHRAAQHMD
jgi:tripartite-type tricarboxylate transporter receptor subunit TctC